MASTFIYVIGADGGPYKIGISDTPQRRRAQLQNGHPFTLQVLKTWDHDRSWMVEDSAHKILAASRTRGEWFAVTLNQAIEAVERAIQEVNSLPVRKEPTAEPILLMEGSDDDEGAPYECSPQQMARLIRLEEIEAEKGSRLSRREIINLELSGEFGPSWAESRRSQGWKPS